MRPSSTLVGGYVREARKAIGFGQVELAKRVGVSQGWISKIETGELEPDFLFMIALLGLALKKNKRWAISRFAELVHDLLISKK